MKMFRGTGTSIYWTLYLFMPLMCISQASMSSITWSENNGEHDSVLILTVDLAFYGAGDAAHGPIPMTGRTVSYSARGYRKYCCHLKRQLELSQGYQALALIMFSLEM